MSNIIPFDYEGRPVRFNRDGWINATAVAKLFGSRRSEPARPARPGWRGGHQQAEEQETFHWSTYWSASGTT